MLTKNQSPVSLRNGGYLGMSKLAPYLRLSIPSLNLAYPIACRDELWQMGLAKLLVAFIA